MFSSSVEHSALPLRRREDAIDLLRYAPHDESVASASGAQRRALVSGRVGATTFLVDRSWLALFVTTALVCALCTYGLMDGITAGTALILGSAMSAGLSFSLLLHELAHAHVARRMGFEIEHIRLFAGGAACRRKRHIDAPAKQFHVAAAGPAASAVLGVLTLVVAVVATALDRYTTVAAVFWFLAFINLLIAISNLLPVFPFDGGKLVHAFYWRTVRNRRAASERLDRTGREFARITIMLGLLVLSFAGQYLLGFIMLLFGVYLLRLPSPP